MSNEVFVSYSAEETHQIGASLGLKLPLGCVVTFSGDLGSGKTTLIRGLIESATNTSAREICSPTFTYLNIYTGDKTIYHFDLYRLKRENDFLNAGFADFLGGTGICCIEWPEIINGLLPQARIHVTLSYCDEGARKIEIVRYE